MRRVTQEERKQINLELLRYFDRICRGNGIRYSLTGGTLLGAVRHKGFIPWDDDVDVFLARPEYEKLDGAFPNDGRYVWTSPTNTPDYKLHYGRLIDTETEMLNTPSVSGEGKGLFLDACVVDGLPDNPFLQKLHILQLRIDFKGRRISVYDKSRPEYHETGLPVRILKGIVSLTTTTDFWEKRILKHMKKYSFDKGRYVGNFTSQYGSRERMHRSSFASYREMEFEGHMFMVCEGWEEYLKNIFGDYMKLPPPEEREGHHEGEVYWVDDSRTGPECALTNESAAL